MNLLRVFLFIFSFKYACSDWVSEWFTPLQHHYSGIGQANDNRDLDALITDLTPNNIIQNQAKNTLLVEELEDNESISDLNKTLENTINKTKEFIAILKKEISRVSKFQLRLKDIIANGSFGVTVATVWTMDQPARSYLVSRSAWSVCSGDISFPADYPPTNWKSVPKCDYDETPAEKPDPCIFNSIIKYSTIPSTRRSLYAEDDYVCQKHSFRDKLEKYMSVSPSVIQHTCRNGTITTLKESQSKCGPRIVLEYIMYPYSFNMKHIPKGYCGNDHVCRLTVAWHLSNISLENFEFFDFDETFKQYFLSM